MWAGYWGIFYRKFFWDFVNGILRNPGGLQCVADLLVISLLTDTPNHCRAPRGAAFFVTIIVKVPLVQILMMLVGAANVALFWPLPIVKQYPIIYNNLIVRIVALFIQILVDIIVYQVRPLPFNDNKEVN